MLLSAFIPKLLEKTKEGKITWKESVILGNETHWISSKLFDSVCVFTIEKFFVVSNETSLPEETYYLKYCDLNVEVPIVKYMEKVSAQQISGLVKEVRNSLNNAKYTEILKRIEFGLDNLK